MTRLILGSLRESGDPFFLTVEALCRTHTHILGTTGSGKTCALYLLATELMSRGFSVVVVDGKGDLYADLCRFAARAALGPRRLAFLDPATTRAHAPGFNPLLLTGLEPYNRAHIVLEAMMKLHREEGEAKPWLRDYLLNSLAPLAKAGLGLLELESFFRSDTFRELVLRQAQIPRCSRFWSDYSELSKAEQERRMVAAATRASLLWSSGEGFKRIVGQLRDSLDFAALMDASGVLLVNANESSGISAESAWFLGTLVLQKVIETACRRPADRRVPVFVILDECQEFASSDFVRGLAKLRGFGVHLILAHQDLAQLQQVPGLFSSVLMNARNRLVFGVSVHDAAFLEEEVFCGFRPERAVIQERRSIAFRPRQEWVTVESTTHHPSTRTYSSTRSEAEHPGSLSTSESVTEHPDGSEIVTRAESWTEGSVVITETESEGWTDPYDTHTVAKQPITAYEEFLQAPERDLETLADLKERGKAALARQHPRDCTVQVASGRPYAIRVRYTKRPSCSEQVLALWQHLILREYPPGESLDSEIEWRAQHLAYEDPSTTPFTADEPAGDEN